MKHSFCGEIGYEIQVLKVINVKIKISGVCMDRGAGSFSYDDLLSLNADLIYDDSHQWMNVTSYASLLYAYFSYSFLHRYHHPYVLIYLYFLMDCLKQDDHHVSSYLSYVISHSHHQNAIVIIYDVCYLYLFSYHERYLKHVCLTLNFYFGDGCHYG